MKLLASILVFISLWGCSKSEKSEDTNTTPVSTMYFPPINTTTWETKSWQSLNWKSENLQPLLDYLQLKNSKSFMILVDGRIVVEQYFGDQTQDKVWYWASAGKTLTSTVFGIAEQEGFVNRNDKVSKTLGINWTSEPILKENLITNFHLLTMTSGIEDIANGDCVIPNCLTYNADAGSRWAYHNVYVKLQDVIAKATNQTFNDYFKSKLADKIGMTGSWFVSGDNIVFASN